MANKKVGKKSAAANDFLEPKPPINVVPTNICSGRAYNDGAVSVTFELPAGSPPATSYTVTHNLGTKDIVVSIYEVASPYAEIIADVEHTSDTAKTPESSRREEKLPKSDMAPQERPTRGPTRGSHDEDDEYNKKIELKIRKEIDEEVLRKLLED